ncbi:MAG: AMP-binding protein, partial [Rickettsiales bacterium]|nr:AMP-binding protein [Rickettsiales bacterium]
MHYRKIKVLKLFAEKFLKKSTFDSYEDYIAHGVPMVPEGFNFGYDALDEIAKKTPDALAVLWTNDAGEKKEISFRELSEMSNKMANVLTARGFQKGDAMLLFMRRRWEYWVLMMAAHKLGVIPIPSTNQLKAHDIEYRMNMSGAKAAVAFDDGYIMAELTAAKVRVINILDLDNECRTAAKTFDRIPNKNTDTMVIYFTSGTTGMPKMVAHDFTYPLGHINTAVFWQQLKDGDLHFTLSESGWAKCSWGKMYGQWLAGASVFVYDFGGKFPADALLKVLADNKVDSFCAPPTVYKMMIREEIAAANLKNI